MALTPDVLKVFAAADTGRQVQILKRVGLETDAADKVLGYLAGNDSDRYRALMQAIANDEPVSIDQLGLRNADQQRGDSSAAPSRVMGRVA